MSQLQLQRISKEIIDQAERGMVPPRGLPKLVDDYFIQRLKQDEMEHAEVDSRLYEGLRNAVQAEVLPLYEQYLRDTAHVRERKQRRKLWQYVLFQHGFVADADFDQKQTLAQAILTEGTNAEITIVKQREAIASAGGEAQIQLAFATNLVGKRIIMLPSGSGINLQTFDLKRGTRRYSAEVK